MCTPVREPKSRYVLHLIRLSYNTDPRQVLAMLHNRIRVVYCVYPSSETHYISGILLGDLQKKFWTTQTPTQIIALQISNTFQDQDLCTVCTPVREPTPKCVLHLNRFYYNTDPGYVFAMFQKITLVVYFMYCVSIFSLDKLTNFRIRKCVLCVPL